MGEYPLSPYIAWAIVLTLILFFALYVYWVVVSYYIRKYRLGLFGKVVVYGAAAFAGYIVLGVVCASREW